MTPRNHAPEWEDVIVIPFNEPLFASGFNELSLLKRIVRSILPEYFLREWHYKNARVVRSISRQAAADKGVGSGYFLEIIFDDHRDAQSFYPPGWQPRKTFVRVSKRLFEAKPLFIDIFCQYSRVTNSQLKVKAIIAR